MRALFFCLIALGCVSITNTLQCYHCESPDKSGCNDPFDKNSMTDAEKPSDPNAIACVKGKNSEGDKSAVIRYLTSREDDCGGKLNDCQKAPSGGGGTDELCCCTSDLCNGVSRIRQQLITIIFVTISIFAIYQWF